MNATRVRSILRKELREYWRNRQIVVTMAILPLIFSIQPFVEILTLPASAAGELLHKHPLVYMLGIPAIVPATVASYSVAGERGQGTLEPVLSTPIRTGEFLLGKAMAAMVPALAVSYGVFGLFAAAVELLAHPPVAEAVMRGPELLGQLLFTPLVAALSIWAGIAISARSHDPRVAAQLSILASLPTALVAAAIGLTGVHLTAGFVSGVAAALLLVDGLGWRIVSPMVDRERLVTQTRP
jgi:ABC-2 type transport system permease protein